MANPDKLNPLLNQLYEDQESALKSIMEIFGTRLLVFCLDFTHNQAQAEELVQDIFYKLWKHRKKLKEVRAFKAYLYTIARNTCLDYLKKIAKEKALQEGFVLDYELSHNSIEDYLYQKEFQIRYQKAIAQLPPRQQEIFRLNREQGLTYREIAEKLGISTKTVQEHLIRASKTLKSQLFNHAFSLTWLYLLLH